MNIGLLSNGSSNIYVELPKDVYALKKENLVRRIHRCRLGW